MPKVNGKKFPYTKSGMAEAKKAGKRKGEEMMMDRKEMKKKAKKKGMMIKVA